MRNTIRKVTIVVPVLMISCQPAEKSKAGPQAGQLEQTARSLGLEAVFVESDVTSEFVEVIAQLERQRVQALVLPTQAFVWKHRFEIVDAAIKHGWPTMANESEMVRDAGFLIAYSTTQAEQDRALAEFIDRILRGAKPADLPVRQPTKFVLAINLKTARALGLTIPKELLLRADEVIQ